MVAVRSAHRGLADGSRERSWSWIWVLALMAFALLVAAAPSAAEEDTDDEEDPVVEQEKTGIDEIVVTAEKFEESIQRTPISLTAFGQQAIQDFRLQSPVDLTRYTPNLRAVAGADGNNFVVASRGVAFGDTGLISTTHGTGIYVDDVYHQFTMSSLTEVFDLERIEVLRGPQGTLYGRNTTGGAIRFITEQPSGEWGARAALDFGTKARADFKTRFQIPVWGGEGFGVSDSWGELSSLFSFATLNRNAFFPNQCNDQVLVNDSVCTGPADPTNETGRLAGRAAVNWGLRNLNLSYAYDRHRVREVGPEMQMVEFNNSAVAAPAFNGFGAGFGAGFGIDVTPFQDPNRLDILDTNDSQEDKIDTSGHVGTVTYDVDRIGLRIKSVTAFREQTASIFSDRDGTPYSIYGQNDLVDQQQLSTELDFIGENAGDWGRLDYVVGYLYFLFEAEETLLVDLYKDVGLRNTAFWVNGPGGPPGLDNDQNPRLRNESHAFFTHVGYTPPILEDRLKLQVGVRYTYDKKKLNTTVSTWPTSFGDERSWDQWTPEGRISYQLFDELFLYAVVAQGYNAGVFNARAPRPEALAPADKETVLSYEGGFKWQFWENRVRINASGYYQDYDNMQRTNLVVIDFVPVSFIRNAADARIAGMELETQFLPVDGLLLELSYGLTKGEFKDYLVPSDPTDPNSPLIDVADQRKLSNFPENEIHAAIQYTFTGFRWADIVARVDFHYEGLSWVQDGENPLANSDPFSIWDIRLGLQEIEAGGGTLEVAFYGRNIFDRGYREFGIDWDTNSFGSIPWITYGFGEPQTFGGELRWEY